MARIVRDAALISRSARARLAPSTKHWRMLEQGLHLGYRRRATGGTWIARRRNEDGIYREEKLGVADDVQDANGQGILDFSQAQRAARMWWTNAQRLSSGAADPGSAHYTIASALADYVEDYTRRGGKSAPGIGSVVRRNVLPELGAVAVRKLTTRRLLDWHRDIAARPRYWRSRPGAKPNTAPFDPKDAEAVRRRRANANRVLSYLKAALNLAWRNGLVPSDDAWRRVKPFKSVDAPIVRYFSDREIKRLLEVCEGAFRDMVYAGLLTGCRYGELCRLRVADYDPEVSTLAIRESKSGKTRHVTLTEEAAELFDRLIAGREHNEAILTRDDGRAWNRAQQVRLMRELCGRAGINPPAGFHVLRHTHASILAMRGVPMAVIARQLGHADTRMTERHYAHLAPNYVAETIRANFPVLTTSAKHESSVATSPLTLQ